VAVRLLKKFNEEWGRFDKVCSVLVRPPRVLGSQQENDCWWGLVLVIPTLHLGGELYCIVCPLIPHVP